MHPANLWRWEGKVERKTYALVGFTALALKLLVDWLVVTRLFERPWNILSYWRPFGAISGLHSLSPGDQVFAGTMVLLAAPFMWLGLAMTAKRLRDAAQPTWLVALFFAPGVNLIFLLTLCVLPSRIQANLQEGTPWPGPYPLDRVIPRGPAGSALFSLAVTSVLGFLFALLGTQVVATSYGWGLFVGLPFCLGMFAALTHSYHQPRSYGECVTVALLPIAMLGALLLFLAREGVICLLMAAPLAGGLAFLGGNLGYVIQLAHWGRKKITVTLSAVVFLMPGLYGVERFTRPQPGIFVVKSAIEVNAPPARVWEKVVTFAEIPPPQETLFRAGIAYPIRAEINGRGPGAVRHCIFSTGPFVEPITVWDEPHLLRFSVTANPAPMNELTPYGHIEPRHLHGYFESHQGQFLLTELPGGRTRLEGTTWYSHSMWPESYWHFWSDYIIHRIHIRVLDHIRVEAEAKDRAS